MVAENYILNPNRMKYLLQLYTLEEEDLLIKLNSKKITKEMLVNALYNKTPINISFLKKIDNIFEKGLSWYISDRVVDTKESSIFLRKDKFNSDLNFFSKKIINKFEEQKLEIQLLSKLINYNLDRQLKTYSTSNNVKEVKNEIINQFNKKTKELILNKNLKPKITTDKEYLERLIRVIESFNVFVFEYIEQKNKKEKSNFSGFFMKPNVIVIKRQQKYLRREIFTLLHEFAHYLISTEEIHELNDTNFIFSETENWCNNFAFNFLIDGSETEFNTLILANNENNYYKNEIEELYQKTQLSKTAIYTRSLKENKISIKDYNYIYSEIIETLNKEEKNKKLKAQEKLEITGKNKKYFGIQKPICSGLFADILRYNYFEGNIDQNKICKYLNIKGEKFNDFLY